MAGARHVGVDLERLLAFPPNGQIFDSSEHTRPWARYVRLRCLGAWLTWMCLTIKLLESRPLASALASALRRSVRRYSADFTGHLARVTPNCLPVGRVPS